MKTPKFLSKTLHGLLVLLRFSEIVHFITIRSEIVELFYWLALPEKRLFRCELACLVELVPFLRGWSLEHVVDVLAIDLVGHEVERVESVLLTLGEADSLAGSQPYTVGRPGRAGVVIGNRGQNKVASKRLEDGSVHVSIPVPNGQSFRIEVGNALGEWDGLGTNTATDDAIHIVDTEPTDTEMRFFRLIPDVDDEPDE